MPAIVAFPTVIEEAVETFGEVFSNQPERRHFGEYLTGLVVADRKNVASINAEFVDTTDQSCLNRWLNEAPWDAQQLNQQRLSWLQKDPATRYRTAGVIPIDNTLIAHSGKLIEDVGWFWDHAEKRHLIAHDYLIANYVCPSGRYYPLDFRRFRKKDADPTGFKSHTVLCQELVDQVVEASIPGTFAFDSYFSNAAVLNRIARHQRNYVGDLKANRTIGWKGHNVAIGRIAQHLLAPLRQPIVSGTKLQWYFTKTVQLPRVDHPDRVVILWNRKNGRKPAKILITNRIHWHVDVILNTYRKRWTGTETFHRDGKQHLGLGDCQLRTGEGLTRHMYLVIVVHSLLMAQMFTRRAYEWTQHKLTTIGQVCRAITKEVLRKTLTWACEKATDAKWKTEHIMNFLALN